MPGMTAAAFRGIFLYRIYAILAIMIERYTLYDIALLRDRYTLPQGLPKGIKGSYNISPATNQPVVLLRDGVRVVEPILWGLLPGNARNTNSIFRHKTYNVRSELIFDKVSTSSAIREQRCLIPVNGFYQWQKTVNDKQAYYTTRTDRELFSLAGIYSSWKDVDGTITSTFSIITTESNQDLGVIADRMPVLVHRDDEATWLDPAIYDANTLYDIMRPCPDGVLKLTKVGPKVHSIKASGSSLIAPQQ